MMETENEELSRVAPSSSSATEVASVNVKQPVLAELAMIENLLEEVESDELDIDPEVFSTIELSGVNLKESKAKESCELTFKDTITELLQESEESNEQDIDPEIFKAALDAVRFEHQRLQNEFMTLISINEYLQQKLDPDTYDENVKME